jgi:hypothetical protein
MFLHSGFYKDAYIDVFLFGIFNNFKVFISVQKKNRISDKWIRSIKVPVLGLHAADDLVSMVSC